MSAFECAWIHMPFCLGGTLNSLTSYSSFQLSLYSGPGWPILFLMSLCYTFRHGIRALLARNCASCTSVCVCGCCKAFQSTVWGKFYADDPNIYLPFPADLNDSIIMLVICQRIAKIGWDKIPARLKFSLLAQDTSCLMSPRCLLPLLEMCWTWHSWPEN